MTSERSPEGHQQAAGRKCSIMLWMERAQKVTVCWRRLSSSPFVDDLGGQVLGEILARGRSAGCSRNAAEDAQRTLAEELQHFQVVAGVGAVVVRFEHLGQVGTGHAVLVNRGTHLVDDAANDALVDATEVGAGQLDALFELLAGVVARMGKRTPCRRPAPWRRRSSACWQRVVCRSEPGPRSPATSAPLVFTCSSKRANDLFQQDVGVAGGDHVLGGERANGSGGLMLAAARITAVERSVPVSPGRGWATGLKKLTLTP